ncbi:hypothetical protein PYV50_26520 [Pseudomonas sp. H22_DOA]|nr:hypothetical protein PYV50_26520 [Pseudomonas sp. H22_DOA]
MVDEYLTMVVGNSIVLVPEVEGAAAYDDLINSILLAQLVANKKIEKSLRKSGMTPIWKFSMPTGYDPRRRIRHGGSDTTQKNSRQMRLPPC